MTDRGVFRLERDGIVLTEIAQGVDVRRDVLERIGFEVRVSDELQPMDRRLFRAGRMNLIEDFREHEPIRRQSRRMSWPKP